VVVVSDHGMTPTSIERVAIIDPHLDLAATLVESDGSLVALRPLSGSTEDLLARAKQIPHGQAYLRDALPAHFHATANPRLRRCGWWQRKAGNSCSSRLSKSIACVSTSAAICKATTATIRRCRACRASSSPPVRPSQRGVTLPAVENIHVYALLCAVLHLQPAAHDGDDRLIKAALR
jgi:hypothetical protein